MARDIIMAAGGIVVKRGETPLFAVVCLRKRGDWVLPKGKLDNGETPRDAAEREVLEETGHSASVHDYLGTLAYPLGERTKVVHFWHMEAAPTPSRKLMKDISQVAWLPFEDALARLSRSHEYAFLAQVGPMALAAAKTGVHAGPALDIPITLPAPREAARNRSGGLMETLRRWFS
jgi:8-oxo-dGTP diphosphatase